MLPHQRMGIPRGVTQALEESGSSHMCSTIASAMALRSDSMEKHATVRCFLKLQEIKLRLKKIAYPLVDFRSLELLAQSPSQKACKRVPLDWEKGRDLVLSILHIGGH